MSISPGVAAASRQPVLLTLLRQWWPVAAAIALCPLVAALAPTDPSVPIAHARALLDLERSSGTHFEPSLVALVRGHPAIRALLDWFYTWVHLPAAVGALVWISLERRWAFRFTRDVFVIAQCLTAAVYLLFPTAPPWMLSTDHAPEVLPGGLAYHLQSRYAAMPSGHIVFALIVCGTLVILTRPLLLRALGVLYLLLVIFVVLGTGNHLWVDVAAGAMAASIGVVVAARRPGRPLA